VPLLGRGGRASVGGGSQKEKLLRGMRRDKRVLKGLDVRVGVVSADQ